MPDPNDYDKKKDFMNVCVPEVIDEGKSRDQAVAQCSNMWEEKSDEASSNSGGNKSLEEAIREAKEEKGV